MLGNLHTLNRLFAREDFIERKLLLDLPFVQDKIHLPNIYIDNALNLLQIFTKQNPCALGGQHSLPRPSESIECTLTYNFCINNSFIDEWTGVENPGVDSIYFYCLQRFDMSVA